MPPVLFAYVRGGVQDKWTWEQDDLPDDLPDWVKPQQFAEPQPPESEIATSTS